MKTYKSIAYAYPASTNAEKLGFAKTGCWHIDLTYIDVEESDQCKTCLPHGAKGFAAPDHPDLTALFGEYDGDIHPSFAEHGNEKALAALGLLAKAKA